MKQNRLSIGFDDITQNDLSTVGGKGANLGELDRAGLSVPPGFCLSTAAYERFLEKNDLAQFIAAESERVSLTDPATAKRASEAIKARLLAGAMPSEVAEAAVKSWHDLGPINFCAVRSSATVEDLPEASFAGQHDSFLYVAGEAELLLKIKACWASLFNERAIIYRLRNGIDHTRAKMAVVVEAMIESEVSGIAFTADPVSGHRGRIVINSSYGLGEALVGGLVTPDVFQINKKNWQIIAKQLGEKAVAIKAKRGGGTEPTEVQLEQRSRFSLAEGQVIELAKICQQIEDHFGKRPQDIEWALSDGQFYIVQARAITTLYPPPRSALTEKQTRLFFSFNYAQVMTDTISPLGQSLLQLVFFKGQADRPEENYFMVPAAGRLFIDLSDALAFRSFRHHFPNFLAGVFDPLAGRELSAAARRPELRSKLNLRLASKFACMLFRYILPIISNIAANIFWRNPVEAKSKLEALIDRMVRDVRIKFLLAREPAARLSLIRRTTEQFPPRIIKRLAPFVGSGILSLKILERLMAGKDSRDDLTEIGRGLVGNIVMEMDLVIGDLADQLLKNSLLRQAVEADPGLRNRQEIAKHPGGREFFLALDHFLARFGFRGQGEIDIARERYLENQTALSHLILATISTKQQGDHRAKQLELRQRAELAAGRLEQQALKRGGRVKAWLVRRLIKTSRAYLSLREHPKYFIMNNFWLFKQSFNSIGELFSSQGSIEEARDIYWLTFSEVEALVSSPRNYKLEVAKRKEEYSSYKNLSLPRFITSEGEIIRLARSLADFPPGALAGTPVSAGVIEGVARVIRDPKIESLAKGEILVTAFTDPGWTPLFINAAGLVIEVGGIMTHGSIIAREYGLPALVGVENATKLIRDGQRIRLDAERGYVLPLD